MKISLEEFNSKRGDERIQSSKERDAERCHVPGHVNGTLKPESDELLVEMNNAICDLLNKYSEKIGTIEDITISMKAKIRVETDLRVIAVDEEKEEVDLNPPEGYTDVEIVYHDDRNDPCPAKIDRLYVDEILKMESFMGAIMQSTLNSLKTIDNVDRCANITIDIERINPKRQEQGIYPFVHEFDWYLMDDILTTLEYRDVGVTTNPPLWSSTELIREATFSEKEENNET